MSKMKHIKKNIANQPDSLREYCNISGATYEEGRFNAEELKKALLEEQGFICAYCMNTISMDLNEYYKPKVEVEHFLPQKTYPCLTLTYTNLLAVCNGNTAKKSFHCDKTNTKDGKMNGDVVLRRLNPLRKEDSEDLLTYDDNGTIKSKNNNPDVEHDLLNVLNLNNDTLKQHRKKIIDQVLEDLKKRKPTQDWTIQLFDEMIEKWSIRYNNKYRKYCMVAIDFLNRLKQRPKYQ